MNNAETLSELIHIRDYFAQKTIQYEQLDSYQKQLSILETKKASVAPKITRGHSVIIFLIISAFFNFIIQFFTIPSFDVVCIIIVVSIAITWFFSKKVNDNDKQQTIKQLDSQLDATNNSYLHIRDTLISYYNQYKSNNNTSCPLDISYTWPTVISQLVEYVRLGRADTIKEALNLLAIDAQHNEALQVNTNAVQQMSNSLSKKLDEIEINTRYN